MTMDDEHAARMATEHLVELGHRRIGFISGSDEYSLSQWRVDGWRAAMKAAGLGTSGLLAGAISPSRRVKLPRGICSGLPSRRRRSSPAATKWRSQRSKWPVISG